jgi:hypothetical protein
MDNAPGQSQRSPWFYVLLGCGGLAGLICLGSAVFVLFVGKQAKNMVDGVNDPAARTRNAVEQLGAVPEGYNVVASMSMFGAIKLSVMSDQPLLPDGGATPGGRVFSYYRLMSSDQNQASKDFLKGKSQDDAALKQGGVKIDAKNIIKRGELTVDGRKLYYTVARGRLEAPGAGEGDGLNNTVLFDCPDDALRVGVWTQSDPDPTKRADELELAGTVADEAELAKLIKPVNPCGK